MRLNTKIILAGSALLAGLATHEGLELRAYRDIVGVPTICYGSTKDVYMGQRKTKAECDALLKTETSEFGAAVLALVQVPINQNQYDALVSLTYNIGIGALKKSTLLRKLNSGDYDAAAKEFDRWIYAGGRPVNGLRKRRAQERKLFETPVRPSPIDRADSTAILRRPELSPVFA